MNNLQIIKYASLLLFLILYSNNIFSAENRIIFKINDNAYTLLDFKKRIEYLDFVGSNNNLSQKIIIDDYISANLFYEYYVSTNNDNLDKKIDEIFENILKINKENKKEYSYEIDNNNLKLNIKKDYSRKIILENILDKSRNNLNTSKEEIDLLYNIKINYINFEDKNIKNLLSKIYDINDIDLYKVINFLKENDIKFFSKKKEIVNIESIDERIKNNILSNNNFFILENSNKASIFFIEKKFETFDGISANLYSVTSKVDLDNDYLLCTNLIKEKNNSNIINKEYKFINLNDELKNELININDYVKYFNNNENIYIVLCNIKFDKEILENINLNKQINLNVNLIEEKFINKYSKIYNLIKIDE